MGKLKNTLLWSAGIAGALAATNAWIASHALPAGLDLDGGFARYPFRHGDVAYAVTGSGSPILLLHGFGAGNDMNEWSENFAALRANHTVYAMDFLGWGLSDKPHRINSAEDMIEQIVFFLEDIVKEPCALIASSDACAYAIEAAKQRPELVSNLVLVCPSSRDESTAPPHEAWFKRAVKSVLSAPILGQSLTNALASRKSIRQFAEHNLYFDKSRVDERRVAKYYSSAHQSDVQYGLASFLTGALAHDARSAWSEIGQPALLVWGRNARINPLDTAPEWLALKPDARLEVIDDAMLLPHQEHSMRFNALVLDWLKK
ncbi:MAG TPA: alpha/beta fold hydrolase [Abditibacteriaceae bacterium]|jgi:pimeloyl-ACP methyl ester carboxylesterase